MYTQDYESSLDEPMVLNEQDQYSVLCSRIDELDERQQRIEVICAEILEVLKSNNSQQQPVEEAATTANSTVDWIKEPKTHNIKKEHVMHLVIQQSGGLEGAAAELTIANGYADKKRRQGAISRLKDELPCSREEQRRGKKIPLKLIKQSLVDKYINEVEQLAVKHARVPLDRCVNHWGARHFVWSSVAKLYQKWRR
ncbi:hypothetical protein BDB00DRAFT_129080 [Zychaea mexicana]|uniref:uncharacterized protein n=1 Tax=Zychaea mexicana TaxID=64656 RepID=UPI0022FF3F43|nr:uncharacterized protein BDB00DRAFT_129080 [Zychaea mexicana]KAI9484550.1 hypothetical protein BDB00DRAFT_129080 [Zychaea mexicana]